MNSYSNNSSTTGVWTVFLGQRAREREQNERNLSARGVQKETFSHLDGKIAGVRANFVSKWKNTWNPLILFFENSEVLIQSYGFLSKTSKFVSRIRTHHVTHCTINASVFRKCWWLFFSRAFWIFLCYAQTLTTRGFCIFLGAVHVRHKSPTLLFENCNSCTKKKPFVWDFISAPIWCFTVQNEISAVQAISNMCSRLCTLDKYNTQLFKNVYFGLETLKSGDLTNWRWGS